MEKRWLLRRKLGGPSGRIARAAPGSPVTRRPQHRACGLAPSFLGTPPPSPASRWLLQAGACPIPLGPGPEHLQAAISPSGLPPSAPGMGQECPGLQLAVPFLCPQLGALQGLVEGSICKAGGDARSHARPCPTSAPSKMGPGAGSPAHPALPVGSQSPCSYRLVWSGPCDRLSDLLPSFSKQLSPLDPSLPRPLLPVLAPTAPRSPSVSRANAQHQELVTAGPCA